MLGDAVAAALPELRAHAESVMSSTCKVERFDGFGDLDPVSNTQAEVWLLIYEGPCELRTPQNQSQQVFSGEQLVNRQHYIGKLPWATEGVIASDRLTILSAEDPAQVGKAWIISSVFANTNSVARRFTATDNQS